MRRRIVATLSTFVLLACAAAPIARVTVERTDGSKQEYTAAQVPAAVAAITAPATATETPAPPVEPPDKPAPPASGYVRTDTGFTAFPLAAGAREYFVSNKGDDKNPGTLAAPLRTLQKAAALCRNGSGDRVRPLAGSVFYGETFWAVSGKDDAYSGIIAYGEGERPRIETPTNGIRCGKPIRNVAFSGLFITSTTRNPNLPKTFQKDPPEWCGIDLRNEESQNVLVEDCRIEWFGNDIVAHSTKAGKFHRGTRLNRNIITNAWAPRIFGGQGVYTESLRQYVVTENYHDECGRIYAPALGRVLVDTQYRHDEYNNHTTTDMISRGNWFFRAASFGLQNRGGGVHDYDWFWDCGNAANGFGATAVYRNCIVMGGHPRASTDKEIPTGGASGFTLGASNSQVLNCYFWGRPIEQMAGMKYPAEAIGIQRDKSYTPAGPLNWKVEGNGFVFWPLSPGDKSDNLLHISGKPAAMDWGKNFRAKAPPPASVWPDQPLLDYLRNRPMRHWVTRGTPAQVFAEFQKVNGK